MYGMRLKKMELAKRVMVFGLLLSWAVLSIEVLAVTTEVLPSCDFPAVYNFGDSNSDTGGISAAFLPITLPYGETFFRKPSGRSCDGRLVIDFIAEHLALPYLSAYLDSVGSNYRHGANFATGGSTIRQQNESIFVAGISPFSLDFQVAQFTQFKARSINLYNQARNKSSSSDLAKLPIPSDFSKALYTLDIGQNDLSVGFRTMSDAQLRATIPDIVDKFSTAVQQLYQQGARTFWVHNTGPIGCLPTFMFYLGTPKPGVLDQHGCLKSHNDMAEEFNRQLKDRVIKLRKQLPRAALTYVDIYTAKSKLISNASDQGFVAPLKVCCGYHEGWNHVWCGTKGKINNGSEVYGASCKNPLSYIMWDGVHYSEAANKWIAGNILFGGLTDPPVPLLRACYRDTNM
ncbi:GDSL esterase/lipase At5g14450-like [Macadamia integrifolia]|uniref:GDSL esterase/lipase At5g14450-like n=1 Tax=Macadamia integrifolia TaxID=60698 RepID=UPI001C4E961D|nr:GDSL esterase/lipase At5g14450-like [Macadamia integrifolia]